MRKNGINRRTILAATTALGAASLLPRSARAQSGAGPAVTLQFTALDIEKVIAEVSEAAAGLKARAKWT